MKEDKYSELAFLKKCSHNDLKWLADCLIFGVGDSTTKKPRLAEQLTKTKSYLDYKNTSLANAVDAIIDEFQRCGGSTIMNTVRKGGVSYSEILKDICDRLYIYWNPDMPVTMIERNLITYLMERCLVSDKKIADKLYSEWCEAMPIYQSANPDYEFKTDCILDYCMAKANLKEKTMMFIAKELNKMTNTEEKKYDGWLKEIYKQVQKASDRTQLGLLNRIGHIKPISLQGAAYDVTFPATIYIIYMRIKNS